MSKSIGVKNLLILHQYGNFKIKIYILIPKFFSELIEFYKKYIQMKFYNIYLSDTFGKGDSRKNSSHNQKNIKKIK